MTLLNNNVYLQAIRKLQQNKILYTQTKLGSMHITLTNTYGGTTMAKVDGKYQVGKVKD